ncbi:helix-hairpin-helix domain-containing protein [Paenibacillus sp. JX-17]|uniref:Helix-hairpin-helix domain-containing protein n=1 Tax=Paenibacillus lacisoli TaxID=3064525 RepID=A0ABT9CAC7_9BACL|nr:helix-hairpin-helix domain-containing protein [Paenibacillus sp. JX-17]MDO7905498.1 helix-hairpin-helix domain-containing protein [Paenibacillus sp. JX-17]
MKKSWTGAAVILAVVGAVFILLSGTHKEEVDAGWQPLNAAAELALHTRGTQDKNDKQAASFSPKQQTETGAGVNTKAGSSSALVQNQTAAAAVPELPAANNSSGSAESVVKSVESGEQAAVPASSSAAASSTQPAIPEGAVFINTASQTQLTELPGIGEKKAQAILNYRNEHGPFRSVEELLKVKGIGQKMLEKMRAYIVL